MKKAAIFLNSLFLSIGALLVLTAISNRISRNASAAQLTPSTDVSGPIADDTTWTQAGSPYIVIGDVTVNAGVTLAIEPGVEVRFDGNFAIIILGRLAAEGTETLPILFTSNLPSPAPGDWGALDFRSGSQLNHLQHAVIEYGGNTTRGGAQVVTNTSSLIIEHTTLRHSATRGVRLYQSSATVSNNIFDHNVNEAIRLDACDLSIGECHPIIAGNTFTNNQMPILHIGPHNPSLNGNSANHNQINGYVFYVSCNVQGHNTFYADDLPYVIPSSGGWCLMGNDTHSSTFEFQPGVVFKLENSLQFHYSSVVTATGTTEQPIIFTSLKDDSVGGNADITSDTNNDGSATSPEALNWGVVRHYGAEVRALYEHAIFQYGGNTSVWGPMLATAGGANVTVQQSEFSQSRVGATIENGSNLSFLNNDIHHMSVFGIYDASWTGSVLIDNNRFTNITFDGMRVERGSPVMRNNFFQGNLIGVRVICSSPPCSPVVSPHNRFIGSEQTGVYVNYPASVCVDARRNWWGDVSGPTDASTAADACAMADNPGGMGTPVTNGVNYSPWEGGLGRPVIASPRCGLTAQDLPTFNGQAAEGATVSILDGLTLLGQTIAGADDLFSWTPTEPLTDGVHSLTAIAELAGQTSLPSAPPLELEVNSSLPFDPLGVRIIYNLHGVQYVQALRDARGCASLQVDPETPIPVRPGTMITVTVPIRTDSEQTVSAFEAMPAGQSASFIQPPSTGLYPAKQVRVYNGSNETITGFRTASPVGLPENRVYGNYSDKKPFLDRTSIPPGQFGYIEIADPGDVVFVTEGGVVFRQEVDPNQAGSDQIDIPDVGPMGTIKFSNNTGLPFTQIYMGIPVDGGPDYFGGPNLLNPIPAGKPGQISMSAGSQAGAVRYLLAIDVFGVYHPLKVHTYPGTENPPVLLEAEYGELDVINRFSKPICDFGLTPYDANEDETQPSLNRPLNLLQFLEPDEHKQLGVNEQLRRIKVAAGTYYWRAYYCDGSLAGDGKVEISAYDKGSDTRVLELQCRNKVSLGPNNAPLQKKPQGDRPEALFEEHWASLPMAPGPLSFTICTGGFACESSIGKVLIDPDGYVYNAILGLKARVASATVTCEVYDEDYQSWSRWPAELYESQINPQVTQIDGYYAFFVPPGFYRVTASTPYYQPHTSPIIQVIDEIVHYNIPLTSLLRYVFLPFVWGQ